MKRSIWTVATALVPALILGLSACSSGNDSSSTPSTQAATGSPATNASASSLSSSASESPSSSQASGSASTGAQSVKLPEDIVARGKLIVAMDPESPPVSGKTDAGKIYGTDFDIANAIAGYLGIKVEIIDAGSGTALIPGVSAGRYDVAVAAYMDTKVREESVTFVTYMQSGVTAVVPKGNPKHVTGELKSLCGQTVAAVRGGSSAQYVTDNNVCDSGQQIKVQAYDTGADVQLAIKSGKVDAAFMDYAPAHHLVEQNSDLVQATDLLFREAPCGILVKKGNLQLAQALQGAVNALIQDGTIPGILKAANLPMAVIDHSEINGARY